MLQKMGGGEPGSKKKKGDLTTPHGGRERGCVLTLLSSGKREGKKRQPGKKDNRYEPEHREKWEKKRGKDKFKFVHWKEKKRRNASKRKRTDTPLHRGRGGRGREKKGSHLNSSQPFSLKGRGETMKGERGKKGKSQHTTYYE